MKKLEDYLHLYLGCDVMYLDTKCTLTGANPKKGYFIMNMYAERIRVDKGTFELILRPLSDMIDREKRLARSYDHKVIGIENSIKHWADLINRLRQKGLDCDGLIEAGLAIDKTTLK